MTRLRPSTWPCCARPARSPVTTGRMLASRCAVIKPTRATGLAPSAASRWGRKPAAIPDAMKVRRFIGASQRRRLFSRYMRRQSQAEMNNTPRRRMRQLLDHFVGADDQRFGDGEPEGSRRAQIDDQLEMGRLLDRKIRRFRALQNAIGIMRETLV